MVQSDIAVEKKYRLLTTVPDVTTSNKNLSKWQSIKKYSDISHPSTSYDIINKNYRRKGNNIDLEIKCRGNCNYSFFNIPPIKHNINLNHFESHLRSYQFFSKRFRTTGVRKTTQRLSISKRLFVHDSAFDSDQKV